MWNLFQAIINSGAPPEPEPMPVPRQQLANELTTELERLGLFQVMLKTPGTPLSDLAMRTYGLGPYAEGIEDE